MLAILKVTSDFSLWFNLHFPIQSHHFMGNRWGNSRNSVRLYLCWGSEITADGDCSHEIKRRLLLDIYLKELKAGTQTGACTPVFIAALFTAAKKWNKPAVPQQMSS